MPISRSAKKSFRKSVTNHQSNLSLKNKFKEMIKKFLIKPSAAKAGEVQSIIDRAVKKGIIHKNKGARLKSQISKKISKTEEPKEVKKVVKKIAKKKAAKKAVK
jgi:small subunit ribosomal protein S20